MSDDKISLAEYEERWRKVQNVLTERGIDVLVVYGSESEPQNLIYLADYWPAFETSAVVIPREGLPALVIGPETKTFAESSGVIKKLFQVLEHRESSEPNYPNQKLATYADVFDFVSKSKGVRKVGISGISIISFPVHEAIAGAAGSAEIVKADDILINLR